MTPRARLEIPVRQTGRVKADAAKLSIYSNTLLTVSKLVVGILTGSVSVASEAAHSASDLLASWIAYFSVRFSDRPADESHAFGHGKAENLSGMAEALLIFVVAGWILVEAGKKLAMGEAPSSYGPGIAIMLVSALVNVLVSRRLFAVARATDSMALRADAEHLRTDVWTSAGVLAGLALARATGLHPLDPLIAMGVALLLVRAAWMLARHATDSLLDAQLPPDEIDLVIEVLDAEQEILGFHKLRTRKAGPERHIDAHIQVRDELSLIEAHHLAEEVEDRIRARLPGAEITLHVEPYHAEQMHQFERHGGPAPDSELPS